MSMTDFWEPLVVFASVEFHGPPNRVRRVFALLTLTYHGSQLIGKTGNPHRHGFRTCAPPIHRLGPPNPYVVIESRALFAEFWQTSPPD